MNRGLLDPSFARTLYDPGRSTRHCFGFCFLTTMLLLGAMILLTNLNPFRIDPAVAFERYYYRGILGCLLIHYARDAYLFAASSRRAVSVDRVPYAVFNRST